ncbi:MAG: trypsin-like peptidase domain-containing protein [Actinomycetota bacterium]|nr:trypsin-like peptidase domain-containing protein [Actinomycetota bacterium]
MPLAVRLVEVIADRGETAHPRYRYGSGCIVVGRTVLTAAHVVAGAQKVEVRDPDKVVRPVTVDERFVGDADGPGPDLALVEVDSSTLDAAAIPLAMVDRDAEPVERCHAVGYPWFAERPSPDAVRDTVDAYGFVPVLSRLASGLLSLQVIGAPRPLPPEERSLAESEWSGMSGAPVVAGGCLLGVVTEHAAREGPSTITITPLTALERDRAHERWGPGVTDPDSWWARLGVPGLAELERLPPRRVRPEPAYRATVRGIQRRTRKLRGRKHELSEIAAFATSSEGYRWIVGGAWTGKTALLAASIAALPSEVDVVAYFLSRVEADAASSRFLGAVVPQLADLFDDDPPVADWHQFRALWERACSAAAAAERHLLLVVDGLDEDLHPTGSPSVAAFLPTIPGGRAHVLVSSRPYPELPSDVPVGHPLLSTPQTRLEPFPGAAELAALARQEIDELKRREDGLATDVLAVFTAAAGPLAVRDLATLSTDVRPVTPAHTRGVRRLVTEHAARSLEPVGSPTTRRYRFAHGSLLEYAQDDQDLTDPVYRQRIHRWADEWAAAGWPAGSVADGGTPRYLLEAYPATLAGDPKHPAGPEDLKRLANLVTDIGWVDSAVARVGVDAVLVSLRVAAQATSAHTPADSVLRVLEQEAHHLRHPNAANQIGYAATALAWRAMALGGVDEMATAACDRLRGLPAPQLVPIWTTERISPNLVSELGRQHDLVSALAVTGEGLVVSGSEDGAVWLWDPRTPGNPGRELGHHQGSVSALAVTGDGQLSVATPSGITAFNLITASP